MILSCAAIVTVPPDPAVPFAVIAPDCVTPAPCTEIAPPCAPFALITPVSVIKRPATAIAPPVPVADDASSVPDMSMTPSAADPGVPA